MVIFASSIGRSGTAYLANLFDRCTSIPSFHACEPLCHGDVQRCVCEGMPRPELQQKAEIIAKIEREKGAYFESSQVFMRVLAKDFLLRFSEVAVVHLLRDPEEVARSYVNRDSFPSHPSRPWRLPLNTRCAILNAPQNLTPFQENLCDWLDNELHYLALKHLFSRTVDLHFADFGSAAALERLFADLGVSFDAKRIQQHTQARDLGRNPNKVKTTVSSADRQQMLSLVSTLKESKFDASTFRLACYARFPFIQALTGDT